MPPHRPLVASCDDIRPHFDTGCSVLLSDVRWRWITAHFRRAEGLGKSQQEVAEKAFGRDAAYISKLLSRKHGKRGAVKHATFEDYRRVRYGLVKLNVQMDELPDVERANGQPDREREDRRFQVAGSLVALNELGRDFHRCHPLGPLHYFCLERMSATKRVVPTEETWAEAEAWDDPARLQRAAEHIHRQALEDVTDLLPFVLEDYATAADKNTLGRVEKKKFVVEWERFRTLYSVWRDLYLKVRACTSNPAPVPPTADRTNTRTPRPNRT